MDTSIPSSDELKARLQELTPGQMDALARMSGVSVHTLIKLKNGQTDNPRLETVRAFLPHIHKARAMAADGKDRRDASQQYVGVTQYRRESDKPR
jgi:predicted transcriptional regulator